MIFKKISKVSTILSSLKYNILTPLFAKIVSRYTLLSSVYKKNSAEHIPIVVSNQQMLSLFRRQKYYLMLTICTAMNQIALSPKFSE